MADENLADQNRRKLEEHLAKMQQGGVRRGGKDAKDNAQRQADPDKAGNEPPPPPPKPPGWDAWKKAHGGRIHQVQYKDSAQVAEEADYKLLELEKGASKEDIRRNYGRLAKEFHPDVGGDAEIFQAMTAAYKRLLKSKGG